MSNITLNAGIRNNLLQLQSSSKLFNRTTDRLASGKKVNTAIDNPTNFFASVNLQDRASGLMGRLDSMGQAVNRIKAASDGISNIRSYVSAMKGVVNNALGNTDSAARQALGSQFNELIKQINSTAKDATYGGVNLIQDLRGSNISTGETETVQFNETFDDSTLKVAGFNIQAGTVTDNAGKVAVASAGTLESGNIAVEGGHSTGTAALVIASQTGTGAVGIQGYDASGGAQSASGTASINWGGANYKTELANVIKQLEAFDNELKAQSGNLSTNLAVITTREEFTNQLVNTLRSGSDKLTLADLNEEGANLLALQTSSQLATQSLALASQQSQSVLQLLG